MPVMASFCAVLSPTRFLEEILDLIESVSEGFSTYSCIFLGNLRNSKLLLKSVYLVALPLPLVVSSRSLIAFVSGIFLVYRFVLAVPRRLFCFGSVVI